jgi:hypothetical protein
MIEVKISKDQIARAEKLYPFENLKGSIMRGESDIYGALGEVLIQDHYEDREMDTNSTYDYDLILDGWKKIDVKTKRTTVYPQPNYTCSITHKQKCHYYFFVRILEDLTTGYLLGYIEAETMHRSAFKKKGELDDSGFAYRADGYHIKIKQLHKFKKGKRDE